MYKKENWFEILFVVAILGTEFPKCLLLVQETEIKGLVNLDEIADCTRLYRLYKTLQTYWSVIA